MITIEGQPIFEGDEPRTSLLREAFQVSQRSCVSSRPVCGKLLQNRSQPLTRPTRGHRMSETFGSCLDD
jgi:hypothetical protein